MISGIMSIQFGLFVLFLYSFILFSLNISYLAQTIFVHVSSSCFSFLSIYDKNKKNKLGFIGFGLSIINFIILMIIVFNLTIIFYT